MIGPRSEVAHHSPLTQGFGRSRTWRRRMHSGKLYAFTAIAMPDGEQRYVVNRYDGPEHLLGTGTFGRDWMRLHFIRYRPEHDTAAGVPA